MKNLFLTSSFAEVSDQFKEIITEPLAGKTVTFIPTASNPETIKFYAEDDQLALEKLGLQIEVLDIENEDYTTIEKTLLKNDYIFVSGGNTFYLIQELRRSKADLVIKRLINQGKLYIGSSAGAIVLATELEYITQLDEPSTAKDLNDTKGMGVINFSILPHFEEQPFSEITLKIFNEYHEKVVIVPMNNRQFIYIN